MEKHEKSNPNPPDDKDEDDDVVGFADAPMSREDDTNTITTQSSTETEHEAGPSSASKNQQTAPPTPGATIKLTGWRDAVHGIVLLSAITLPWIVSMILSWTPLTRIPLSDAPKEVLVSIVASTTEVGFLFLQFVVLPCVDPKAGPGWSINLLLFFIVLCPIITGSCVWNASDQLSCKNQRHSPACRVGADFIRAIGCFRALGVLGMFATGLWLTNVVTKRMEKLQKQKDAQAGDSV